MPILREPPDAAPFLSGRPDRVGVTWRDWFQDLWRQIAGGLGSYQDVTFDAANFTGSGAMTWTVGSADVTTLQRRIDGDRMTLSFYLLNTSVGGVLASALRIAIPDGHTAARTELFPIVVNDAGAGNEDGFAQVTAGQAFVEIYRQSGALWSASVNATRVFGQIPFRITT